MAELALITDTPSEGDAGGTPTPVARDMAAYIRSELQSMAMFRTSIGLEERLLRCARMRDGQYDPTKLADIRKFGGSEVYARIVGNKVRGSYSILSGIFTRGERPWAISATPEPTLPEDISAAVQQLMTSEAQALMQAGQEVDKGMLQRRYFQLMTAAKEAARQTARMDAEVATRYLDDYLVEGGYYIALDDFLIDFCTYPFAVLRGPTAMMTTDVRYVNGQPQRQRRPVLRFFRVNPHDFLWSSGATSIENANTIERMRLTRADLNALIGLEGYDEDAVRSAIRDYGASGYVESQFIQSEKDRLENQQSVVFSDTIDAICYTGCMPGHMLKEFGVPDSAVENGIDDDLDYLAQAYMVGQYLLKVSIDPDPRNRIPYYVASYEPKPGSIAGTALPELLTDVQEVCNSIMRAAVNNMAFSSGPQVVVDTMRLATGENANEMYPWKIWKFDGEPSMAQQKPIEFFQPTSNLMELIQTFGFFSQLGDEVSAIPRYVTGNERVGGAGRTASGLSMLMSNANRTMTSIASAIDNLIQEPLLQKLYDLVLMVTGNTILRGDENIVVRGATYAETKETDRMRLLEFLQMTTNPIDTQIMGIEGRSVILRKISETLGLDGERVIPSPAEQQAAQQQAAIDQEAQAGGQPGRPANPGPTQTGPNPNAPPEPPKQQPGQKKPTQRTSVPSVSQTPGNNMARETDNAFRART